MTRIIRDATSSLSTSVGKRFAIDYHEQGRSYCMKDGSSLMAYFKNLFGTDLLYALRLKQNP